MEGLGRSHDAAATAAGASSTATSSASILTAMNTSKAFLITAAFVTAVCVPIGYHIRTSNEPTAAIHSGAQVEAESAKASQKMPPSFEGSALFAQWKQLHDTYGTTAEAMPDIYQAIASLKDPFQRRAFRAALIAEWVQLDPTNGLEFFLRRGSDAGQRQHQRLPSTLDAVVEGHIALVFLAIKIHNRARQFEFCGI